MQAVPKSSASRPRRIFTAEHRMRIGAAKIGKKRSPFSPEWRANISAGRKGKGKGQRQLPARRFWAKVETGPVSCWIWVGGRTRGRGMLHVAGRHVQAHRFAYELFVGPIPRGLSVLHRCDVPACVNPQHLFLGTQADNIADMHAKGRAPRHTRPSVIWGARNEIRELFQSGVTKKALARRFSVDPKTIRRILANTQEG